MNPAWPGVAEWRGEYTASISVHPALQAIPETLPESPLPGGVAAVVRFFFHVPQWIQIGGAILGALAAAAVLFLLWKKREAIWTWIRTRPTATQIILGAAVAVILTVVAGFGAVSWDYMQHDNDFCTGCHIMGPSFRKFTESEHADLNCHDCHQQSMSASARQLYLWVLDRPEEIGEHAPVPNRICAECHIQERPDSVWQRIAATAGHRVHLESDTAALAEVMCVTCHGEEVHRFVPADQTCGQADCHAEETTRIVLGEMSGQTGMHCVTCHEFTAPVPEEAALDTAFAALVPEQRQCFACHEMESLMGAFDPGVDPHAGICGDCHNPHIQEAPAAAFATCTDAGCHAQPDTLSPFHRGIGVAVLEDCGTCHEAHEWTVEGENCGACHAEIPGAGIAASRAAGAAIVAGAPVEAAAANDLAAPAANGSRGRPAGRAHPGLDLPPSHPPIDGGSGTRAEAGRAEAGTRSGASARHFALGSAVGWVGAGVAAVPGDGGADRTATVAGLAAPAPIQERWAGFDHADHVELDCAECHSSEERHGAITLGGGGACFDCHHGPVARDEGCGDCHAGGDLARAYEVTRPLSLSVWEGTRTRTLPFGHGTHSGIACGECHTGGRTLSAERACSDCHAEHHRADADCIACHAEPPEDAHPVEVHVDGCAGAGCHRGEAYGGLAYGALPKSRDFCLSCHQDQVDHEPGELCAGCHRVPEAGGPVGLRGAAGGFRDTGGGG